jgi:hypothetical protein
MPGCRPDGPDGTVVDPCTPPTLLVYGNWRVIWRFGRFATGTRPRRIFIGPTWS